MEPNTSIEDRIRMHERRPADQPVVPPPKAELLERLAKLEAELVALRLAMA